MLFCVSHIKLNIPTLDNGIFLHVVYIYHCPEAVCLQLAPDKATSRSWQCPGCPPASAKVKVILCRDMSLMSAGTVSPCPTHILRCVLLSQETMPHLMLLHYHWSRLFSCFSPLWDTTSTCPV